MFDDVPLPADPAAAPPEGAGSIIVPVATDAPLRMLADAHITGLFEAVVEATEEAIVNALLAAETMEGRDGIIAHGLDGERLAARLARA